MYTGTQEKGMPVNTGSLNYKLNCWHTIAVVYPLTYLPTTQACMHAHTYPTNYATKDVDTKHPNNTVNFAMVFRPSTWDTAAYCYNSGTTNTYIMYRCIQCVSSTLHNLTDMSNMTA